MKKRSFILTLLALVLVLTACGTQAAAPEAAPSEAVPETTVPTTAEAVQEIQITTENWQDYFEKRDAQRVQLNDRGDIIFREFGYGIFLKDEYVSRLAQTDPVDVSFDMQADSVRYQVYGDLTTNNFIVRDDVIHDEGTLILTSPVEDYRGSDRIEAGSDFHNSVGAFFTINEEFSA